MTWQDEQKQVATGVTDGTDGREYSKVFPYEPMPIKYNCRMRMGQNGVTWYDGSGNVTMHIDSENGVTVTKQRVDDDDDIQEYKRPWVGLTGDEVNEFAAGCHLGNSVQGAIRKAEAKLKEKNT